MRRSSGCVASSRAGRPDRFGGVWPERHDNEHHRERVAPASRSALGAPLQSFRPRLASSHSSPFASRQNSHVDDFEGKASCVPGRRPVRSNARRSDTLEPGVGECGVSARVRGAIPRAVPAHPCDVSVSCRMPFAIRKSTGVAKLSRATALPRAAPLPRLERHRVWLLGSGRSSSCRVAARRRDDTIRQRRHWVCAPDGSKP